MSISISGSNAITGLSGNDTDFDKVLSQLKKIESTQLNRLEAWKSDWNLRYESFTKIIEQVQAASSMLSQLSDKNDFVTKLVQSSNDNVITAVANASAQDVQHTIKVSQVASNAIWANTGHIFESKTDIINTTGQDQYFSYTYAGKRHDFKVPANTTLDSFVSMINNSTDNPGIKISLIQTGKGYVFQVAGKDTGVENDLIIHDSNLVGMSAAGTTSLWQTNSTLNTDQTLTNPSSFVFDLVLSGGVKKSVTIKGNSTPEDVVNALNNAAGGIKASYDSNGNLNIEGVQSFYLRKDNEDAYVPEGLKFSMTNGRYDKLNKTSFAANLPDDTLITVNFSMANGESRTIDVRADITQEEFLMTLARATQNPDNLSLSFENSEWFTNLEGVTGISFTYGDDNTTLNTGFSTVKIDGKGDHEGRYAPYNANLKADTTLTFDKDKLSERIDGKAAGEPGETLAFILTKEDGSSVNITIDGSATNQELIDKIQQEIGTPDQGTDKDGNVTVQLDGIREFRLAGGSVKSASWKSELKSSMRIDASTGIFHTEDGVTTLEKAPDLVYTFQTNDGLTGTLTMPSGSSMKDILEAIQDPSAVGWVWKDADGNPAPGPAQWDVSFTDAEGNVLTDLSGNVHLNIKNITSMSGPGISGQIVESTNWNIQRAANARFQVDNWPLEMESASNSISDAIEGVVFSIQDVGEARMTVSTDITSVEQSIQNFLDAVNSVLLTVNELMKYDENKTITSNDPNDIGSDNYSASGLTNQKGNLLTGNYGVQLFKSRFSSVLGSTPPGFQSKQSATDILSGDMLASLANLGIKTDTDSTSDTYGLLVLAPSSSIAAMQEMDKSNYNEMITKNLEAVVDFFCASGSGASTSTEFRYQSHVEGITRAGAYEVTYNVDSSGNITEVYIGGEKAVRDDSMPGNYYSVASGDARGLSILIDDLTVGEHPPAGAEPMYVRIKQGLVQTTNNFLKGELVFNDINIPYNATEQEVADAIALKSQNGALMSLRDNYKTVMEGIDAKIEREQRRISTWEARQKAIFANLETLLSKYGEQQKQLEGQLAQLSGNKN